MKTLLTPGKNLMKKTLSSLRKKNETTVSWDEEEEDETPPPPTKTETNDSKPKEKKEKKKKPKKPKKSKATQNAPEDPEDPEEDQFSQKMRIEKLVQETDFENLKEIFSGFAEAEPQKPETVQPQRHQSYDEDEDEEYYETVPKSNNEKPKLQAKAKVKAVIQADINIEETVADLVKKLKPISVNPQFFRCYKALIQSATKSLSADEMKEISKVFTNVSNSKIIQSDKKKKSAKPARQQLKVDNEEDVYDDL